MEIIELESKTQIERETVIALGNFDGIHKGHTVLLEEVVKLSKSFNCPASVLIFKNHTKNLTAGISQELLTSRTQKHELLQQAGIDIVYEVEFNEHMMHLSPEAFVRDFLVQHLKVKGVVVGYDYRFGYKASGDVTLLRSLSKKLALSLVVKDAITYEGEVISSTRIRQAIKSGQLQLAQALLGRPFTIRGIVTRGKQLGRTIGIPTANLLFNTHYVKPRFGVYLARVKVDKAFYYAATNIGTNPTFSEREIKVESYLYNFSDNLYDKEIDVELLSFIRPEIRFENVEALKKRMDEDLKYISEKIPVVEFTK